MQLILDNDIAIYEATKDEQNKIKAMLTIENPQYFQNEKMGFSNYKTDKFLKLYEDGDELHVPIGILDKLVDKFDCDVAFNGFEPSSIKFNSNIELYDYQERVVEEAYLRSGIIVMPAGSGKTQTALELIARMGYRTLWLTHTIDLLNQSYQRAKDNLPGIGLGKVTSGKAQLGSHITFATVQTFRNLDLRAYKNIFDVIVVDECHRVVGSANQAGMFYEVINSLSAKYKIGLTATPYRNMKGTEIAMFSLLGEPIIEISKDVVKTTKAKVHKVTYDFELPKSCFKDDGTINFAAALNKLAEYKDRNLQIAKLIDSLDGSTLVLSDRLEQLESIKDMLGYGAMIHGKMTSKKGKAEREAIIQAMRDRKERVLFASYSLAKEGLDIPCLDNLILATPKKDKATIIQSVGRIERQFEGKTEPRVYDIVDSEHIFQLMWYARQRIYKSNGNL